MNNQAVVGQLVELSHREKVKKDASWNYGVIMYIYDDRYEIHLDNGVRYMHVFENGILEGEENVLHEQPTKRHLTLLFKNGSPVMAKKKLFGGYIPQPKY